MIQLFIPLLLAAGAVNAAGPCAQNDIGVTNTNVEYLECNKISELTEELTPAAGDFLLAEDALGNVRKVDVCNIFAGGDKCGSIAFDPTAWYAQDAVTHNLPLFEVDATQYPSGITFQRWTLTYTTGDPTTELAASLYRASDWAWTAETAMDVLNTTAGSSSESTPGNINGGAAVAAGQRVYIGFTADPTDSNVVTHFQYCYR